MTTGLRDACSASSLLWGPSLLDRCLTSGMSQHFRRSAMLSAQRQHRPSWHSINEVQFLAPMAAPFLEILQQARHTKLSRTDLSLRIWDGCSHSVLAFGWYRYHRSRQDGSTSSSTNSRQTATPSHCCPCSPTYSPPSSRST